MSVAFVLQGSYLTSHLCGSELMTKKPRFLRQHQALNARNCTTGRQNTAFMTAPPRVLSAASSRIGAHVEIGDNAPGARTNDLSVSDVSWVPPVNPRRQEPLAK